MGESLESFVGRSDVRRAVLGAAADGGTATGDLLADLDAGRSAVYKAASSLRERGLLWERDDGRLEPTAAGTVVADRLADRERVVDLLADGDYWRTHDASVVPREFRRRLPELADAEVVRSPETDPTRAPRRVREVFEDAGDLDVFVPVFHPEHADLADERAHVAEPRLLVSTDLPVDHYRALVETGRVERPDPVSMRVGDVPCNLVVTDDAVVLRLPTREGEFDPSAFLLARDGDALAWGRDLFEARWQAGEPLLGGST